MAAARGVAARLGSGVLTVAATAGALCIAAAIAAVALHVNLILFRTGSMSPTIPAGSVALVREIPAAEARVGDIVTVDRPGRLPITHRVVSAEGAADGRRLLVLRGDANRENDPEPYLVDKVRIVLWSAPGGAQALAFVSRPMFLLPATLAASALVAWAFWPRDERRSGRRARREGRSRGRRSVHRAAATAVLLLLPAVGVAAPDAARAATPSPDAQTTHATSRFLTLTSTISPSASAALRPGVPVRWIVGVEARPPHPTDVRLSLEGSGTLASALAVSVSACDAAWTADRCPGTVETLLADTALRPWADTKAELPLGAIPSERPQWLAIDVTRLSGSSLGWAALDLRASMQGEVAEVTTGAGVSRSGDGRPGYAPSWAEALSDTGWVASPWSGALAAAAIMTGIGLAGLARLRRRRS